MSWIRLIIRLKLTTYRRLSLIGCLLAWIACPIWMMAQAPDPHGSIKNLREGTLIVRFPTYTAKIDTLKSLIARSTEPNAKARMEKLLRETIQTRDTLHHDYIQAFKNNYRFSKVAYFYDFDAYNLNTAAYYNLDGERLAVADLSEKPIFYLYFERTAESKIDALVIYDRNLKIVPRPFPNNFSRGGMNFLFLKISHKNFPAWRVGKINKQLVKFYQEVNLLDHE